MAKEEQDIKDSKAIEEKALNYFKAFIEDSKVISQFIADNDKEPCWDGHLYLYSEGKRDKEHLQQQGVGIQVVGVLEPQASGQCAIAVDGREDGRHLERGWRGVPEGTHGGREVGGR